MLRLLLAAAPMLAAAQLGEYLALTLDNSRKSRRRVKMHMLSSTGDFSVREASRANECSVPEVNSEPVGSC